MDPEPGESETNGSREIVGKWMSLSHRQADELATFIGLQKRKRWQLGPSLDRAQSGSKTGPSKTAKLPNQLGGCAGPDWRSPWVAVCPTSHRLQGRLCPSTLI